MSNGLFDWPLRLTHPTAPDAGRLYRYTFDDGAGSVDPYYMRDDGVPRTLVGVDGTNGTDGANGTNGTNGTDGIDGIDGAVGPAGAMTVEGAIFRNTTVTLPNSITKTTVYTDTITHSTSGDCYLLVSMAVRPHTASNNSEFDISYGGAILTPTYVEEHKDSSAAQSMWRSYTLDLGTQTAGAKTVLLRYSKGAAGGTAQIKGYTVIAVRYN